MTGWSQIGRTEVLRRRLVGQLLVGGGPAHAADVVELLACVQAQEWAHGFWSLGMRTGAGPSPSPNLVPGPGPGPTLDAAAVQAEFDAGDLLRTHILRPTWHYVTPVDIGWILGVTSPRVHQRSKGTYRQTGIDAATRERCAEVLTAALTGGVALTRPEVAERLAAEGIAASGMRLAHLVMTAELDGLIASGPLQGAQHTYRLLDELVRGREVRRPEDPEAALLARFLAGHGPATLADFTRWSSQTLTAGRAALDRLREAEGDRLVAAQVHDVDDTPVVWWFADAPEPGPASGRAFLVPLYDELTLSYPTVNFATADAHPHVPGTDLFVGSVIVDDADRGPFNAGLWQRTVQGRRVSIGVDLAGSCSARNHEAATEAAAGLARFLGLEWSGLV